MMTIAPMKMPQRCRTARSRNPSRRGDEVPLAATAAIELAMIKSGVKRAEIPRHFRQQKREQEQHRDIDTDRARRPSHRGPDRRAHESEKPTMAAPEPRRRGYTGIIEPPRGNGTRRKDGMADPEAREGESFADDKRQGTDDEELRQGNWPDVASPPSRSGSSRAVFVREDECPEHADGERSDHEP